MNWKCQALTKTGKQCSRNATEKGCYLHCSQHSLSSNLDTLDINSLKDLTKHYDNAFNMNLSNLKKNGKK